MQILFFCPPVTVINGGIKHIFRMAEVLVQAGYDAVVFEEQGRRPWWLDTTAPVVGQGAFRQDRDQILVLPEDQPQIFKVFASWPNKKVVYVQNHFYAALGLGTAESYADFGIAHILCSSQTIGDFMQFRHKGIPLSVIPCLVDSSKFHSNKLKEKEIVYMPRKRPVEALYLQDLFRYANPDLKAWRWTSIENKSEADVAQAMEAAGVFLSLSRLEGFGLTPLEAMASGCIVAGFMGIGGREYATPENGFWVEEDDFSGACNALAQALSLASLPPDHPTRQAYAAAAQTTLAPFTKQEFEKTVCQTWQRIVGS